MYQVFPLKYRPKTFDEIVGQPHITQILKNEIKYGRIATAYLFAGPRGIGKTTTARIVAKALNCVNGPTTEPCNHCDQCKEIQAGNSLDVLEIDGASNRGIDEVRQLRERVKYAPYRGKYRIYIIDEVHMLTSEAFNALLKTIEEPPKHVVFIFATTAPYKLPLTILSRCQRFNFRKISPPTISEKIKNIAQLESTDIEDSACSLIAQFVDGSLRDAISILDQLIPYTGGKITAESVQTLLGLPSQTLFFELTEAMIKRDPSAILTLAQTAMNQGVEATELLSGLISHLQTLFLIKTGVSSDSTSIGLDGQNYALQAKLLEESFILRVINFLFDTEKNMRNALSKEIYLQQALVRVSMCAQLPIEKMIGQLAEMDTINCVSTKIDESGGSHLPGQVDKTWTNEPPEVLKEKPLGVHQLWELLRQNLKPSLGSIVAQATPIELNNGKLWLQCSNDFFKTKIEENLALIEEELKKVANRPINIIFKERGSAYPVKKSVVEEPIVQSAIKIFKAELVPTLHNNVKDER